MHRNPSASKSPVILRPATSADFIAMFGQPPKWRVRGLAAEIDGKLVGLGGLALMMPCETWCAFMRATDEFRARPIALHRAGLRMMAEAKRLGIRRLVALAEPGIEAAPRWLARFGFAPQDIDDATVWVWKRTD
jgi:N-acetylglutamate synthase-like GNAT family acetyltransferase